MRIAPPHLVRIAAAAGVLLAAACSSAPDPEPHPDGAAAESAAAGGAAAPVFAEDPLASAPEAAAPAGGRDPSAPPVFFAEDPLADAPMVAPETAAGARTGSMSETTPPAEPEFDAGLVERSAEMSLAVLRARFLAEEMGRTSEVVIPDRVFTFGERVPVRFRLRNPLSETVELLPPSEGVALVLDWEVERWLPIGGHDVLRRTRWFRLADFLRLAPDETYETRTELPLDLDGDAGAIWRVRIDARLHCGGALLGDRQLPVHRVEYRGARLHAFPPGWQELEADPLGALRRVLGSADPTADRHVLIATALLRGPERYAGLEQLLDCLERPPSPERAFTAVSALQWLTRLPLGDMPEAWIRWRHASTVAATPR